MTPRIWIPAITFRNHTCAKRICREFIRRSPGWSRRARGRPDQRIHVCRLTPGRPAGHLPNRIFEREQWGDRRLDEPTPSEIRQLMIYVKTHVVARRNARGGRSAEEHLVAALRCVYKRRGGRAHQGVR